MNRSFIPIRGRRFENGFTLPEILVTVFIVALVTTILMQMVILLLRANSFYGARAAMFQEASATVKAVVDTTAPSHSIEPSRDIDGVPYTTDDNTVVLKLASIDAAGLPIAGTFDYVVIERDASDPQRAYLVTDADGASSRHDQKKLLAEHVGDLAITYLNGSPATSSELFFSITMKDTVNRSIILLTLSTNATLRNK